MKKHLFILLFLGFILGCSSDDNNTTPVEQYDSSIAYQLTNIAYGTDARQKMDIYLPANRNSNDTKVIILIHGGFWIEGSKEDLNEAIPVIQAAFPDYAIANINYRLASAQSPVYPKQIDDISSVIAALKNGGYDIANNYAMIGVSAGAHLSLLYSYAHDTNHEVKAICDIVGPADFTDPEYLSHPLYSYAASLLTGTTTPSDAMIAQVNPIVYITAQSPPTQLFYGGQDNLIPASQGPRLSDKLTEFGIANELNFYPNDGHADWDDATWAEVYAKMTAFLETHF